LVWSFAQHKPIHSIRLGIPVRSISWRSSDLPAEKNPIIIGLMDGSIYSWVLVPNRNVASSSQTEDNGVGVVLVASLKDSVTSLAWEYSPNPQLLAAGSVDGSFSIFRFSEDGKFALYKTVLAHEPAKEQNLDFGSLHKFAEIWSLCWSPDNAYIATASEDQKTRIWNASSGDIVQELVGHTSAVTCVDWQSTKIGNLLATCGDDRTVMIWDANTFALYHVFETKEIEDWHTATYLALERGNSGTRIACVTQNGWLLVWDLVTKNKLIGRRLHLGSIEGLRWHHPSGLMVTCSSDCAVNVLDMNVDK